MSENNRKIRLAMNLRRQGISDTRVLAAMEKVPRDAFVPETFADRAWEDVALPIASGQTISQPYVVAYMTQALAVTADHTVLEVGTGSGYQAAILSHLCKRVYTIERYANLLAEAKARFEHLGLENVITRTGDGIKGWPEVAPFDRIIVTAAAETVPDALIEQLRDGGIMIIPVGTRDGVQEIIKITKRGGETEKESLLPVRFVPLLGGIARAHDES